MEPVCCEPYLMDVCDVIFEFINDGSCADSVELHRERVTLCCSFCRGYFPTTYNEEACGLSIGVYQDLGERGAEILHVVECYLSVYLVEGVQLKWIQSLAF